MHINPAVLVSCIGLLLTAIIAGAGYLVQWGIFKAKIEAMGKRLEMVEKAAEDRITTLNDAVAKRFESLEAELGQIGDLKVSIGEIKTGMAFMLEQMKDMNASIRWMREVPPHTPLPPDKPSK